ncbi:MAG: F0F1 ATP synthase subunit A [Candidatus Omnitrophica bacterium]|nr:F0F1 ATP synthase subunit A [Candidatus Omnitrophota bacterium]
MVEAEAVKHSAPELPNIVGLIAELNSDNSLGLFLHRWESAIYALVVIIFLGFFAYKATRKRETGIPGRLQSAAEFLVTFVDDFVCSVLGPRGSKFTPFVGTLFIYILAMNYIGLIPFLKSPNADWSTTMALSLIVFFYVQYTAFKELGFLGYFDHLAGQPRGIMAVTLVMPIFMLILHIVSELIRPLSLSLRLRSNIYGDDIILALFASWGLKDGFMWLFPNFLLVLLTSTIQAAVFSILTVVYFSLVMKPEDGHHH